MNGGKRPGAGRPKGSKDPHTIEKEKAEALMKQRILNRLDPLLNSQFALAEGLQFLYRIEYFKDEDGKKKKKFVLVESPTEIKEVLDATEGEGGLVDDTYYIVTTKAPDNKAIDSMLDRVFGKATQKDEMKLTANLNHTFDDIPETAYKSIIQREANRFKNGGQE